MREQMAMHRWRHRAHRRGQGAARRAGLRPGDGRPAAAPRDPALHRGPARRLRARPRALAGVDDRRRPPRGRVEDEPEVDIRVVEGGAGRREGGGAGRGAGRRSRPTRAEFEGRREAASRVPGVGSSMGSACAAVGLRARDRARERLVGRPRDGADAAPTLLPALRGHELRRRGRAASSRLRLRIPLADQPTRRTSTSSASLPSTVAPVSAGALRALLRRRCGRRGAPSSAASRRPGTRTRSPSTRRSASRSIGSRRTTTVPARTACCSSSG